MIHVMHRMCFEFELNHSLVNANVMRMKRVSDCVRVFVCMDEYLVFRYWAERRVEVKYTWYNSMHL